jgi:hypothetical protein
VIGGGFLCALSPSGALTYLGTPVSGTFVVAIPPRPLETLTGTIVGKTLAMRITDSLDDDSFVLTRP